MVAGNFIVKTLWIPGDSSSLAIVTADFIKIYSLSVDVISPKYYYLLPAGKVCVIRSPDELYFLFERLCYQRIFWFYCFYSQWWKSIVTFVTEYGFKKKRKTKRNYSSNSNSENVSFYYLFPFLFWPVFSWKMVDLMEEWGLKCERGVSKIYPMCPKKFGLRHCSLVVRWIGQTI